jgi:hypothetical protein
VTLTGIELITLRQQMQAPCACQVGHPHGILPIIADLIHVG